MLWYENIIKKKFQFMFHVHIFAACITKVLTVFCLFIYLFFLFKM